MPAGLFNEVSTHFRDFGARNPCASVQVRILFVGAFPQLVALSDRWYSKKVFYEYFCLQDFLKTKVLRAARQILPE